MRRLPLERRRRSLRPLAEALEGRVVLSALIQEFPSAGPGAPMAIAPGPGGVLYYTTQRGVDTITTAGVSAVFTPTSGTLPPQTIAIAPGPGGALYLSGVSTTVIQEYFQGTPEFPAHDGIPAAGPYYGGGLRPVTVPQYVLTAIGPDGAVGATPTVLTNPTGFFGVTAGPGGSVAATETRADQVALVVPPATTATQLTGGSYLSGSAESIALGPDGNFWITLQPDQGHRFPFGAIVRLTPGGGITAFPVPGNGVVEGIAAGADGNLWFTDPSDDAIGRITTDGTITMFPVPTAFAQPFGITAGPDGNLWFTEVGANAIGRITTAGAVTEFPVPTVNAIPWGITTGPDGNLWFTEDNVGQVGRLLVGTLFTATPPPTPAAAPGPLGGGVTNASASRFSGTGMPGAVVVVAAAPTDGAAPIALGRAVVDPQGHWSLTSSPLADGTYRIIATATTPDGTTSTLPITFPGGSDLLVVDTAGPRVSGLRMEPGRKGLVVALQDNLSGVAPGGPGTAANYALFRVGTGRRPHRVALAASAAPKLVTLARANGKALAPGRYLFGINAAGVTDRAGNALDGRFTGTFPTRTSPAGTDFTARLALGDRGRLKVRALRTSGPRTGA